MSKAFERHLGWGVMFRGVFTKVSKYRVVALDSGSFGIWVPQAFEKAWNGAGLPEKAMEELVGSAPGLRQAIFEVL